MKKKLQNETLFVGFLGQCLFNEIPEDQKKEIDSYFGLQSGKFVSDCNRYMERTTKAIDKEIVSVRGLSINGIDGFVKLLTSEKLDKNLQSKFREVLVEKLEKWVKKLVNQAKELRKLAQEIEVGTEELESVTEAEKIQEQKKLAVSLRELSRNLRREAIDLEKVSRKLDTEV